MYVRHLYLYETSSAKEIMTTTASKDLLQKRFEFLVLSIVLHVKKMEAIGLGGGGGEG